MHHRSDQNIFFSSTFAEIVAARGSRNFPKARVRFTHQDETVSVNSNDQHHEMHVSRPCACVINLRAILDFSFETEKTIGLRRKFPDNFTCFLNFGKNVRHARSESSRWKICRLSWRYLVSSHNNRAVPELRAKITRKQAKVQNEARTQKALILLEWLPRPQAPPLFFSIFSTFFLARSYRTSLGLVVWVLTLNGNS